MSYWVYIMSNPTNKVIYVGVTNNLNKRIYEHKNKLIKGFTEKYNVNKLVYYEQFANINEAIMAEKKIKGWTRNKKSNLINPYWNDLDL